MLLRKRCPEHGEFEALVYSDAEAYIAQQRFNKPGTLPLALQTDIDEGCPLDCGICPAHKQHACLGIIEVNSACNLDCPVCFADSGRQHPDQFALTREQVARMLDVFVQAEGEPEVIQFSGGEPTIHPQILDFVALARERGIRIVMSTPTGSGSRATVASCASSRRWVRTSICSSTAWRRPRTWRCAAVTCAG